MPTDTHTIVVIKKHSKTSYCIHKATWGHLLECIIPSGQPSVTQWTLSMLQGYSRRGNPELKEKIAMRKRGNGLVRRQLEICKSKNREISLSQINSDVTYEIFWPVERFLKNKQTNSHCLPPTDDVLSTMAIPFYNYNAIHHPTL